MSSVLAWVVLVALVVVVLALVGIVVMVRRSAALTASTPSAGLTAEVVEDPRHQAQEAEIAAAREELAGLRARSEQELRVTQEKTGALIATAESARAEADQEARARRAELQEQRSDLERREQRLVDREERLDSEGRSLDDRARQLDELKAQLKAQRHALAEVETERQQALERVAGLTAEQAKAELVAAVEHDAKRQAVLVARDVERQATRDADAKARMIVVGAIQRVASEQTSESVVSAVHLPGDDMKGRIIGREGRNIRAFEQVTGVNVMIDDTPESVLLSSFDPVRRETARMTLTELVKDGRIHPQRIEEVHERSKAQIEQQCLRAAEDAMAEVGISDLHPALVPILGTLRYRTSYGQNVLKHLVESAHIAGLMAAEMGLDIAQCKRSAFLHDIGKALTHEVEGSHAVIGADLARRYGEHPDVVHAIEAHHNEVEVKTVEAILTQAADAISGSRPGARRESIEAYVQRLERLEEIAGARDGVDKVFAMQAGRELRVMVVPEVVDDIEAQVLARDIAKQIEEELTYPGQIRVTVVRESRATETAR
ncbi:ribonucrease Y [Friedmanniella luteola]|uniref:Ribonuclease Y n=1 Tax=Friedmanniella luteola TaxID=546871 RepID=A0A1H1R8Q3_9ACTN|nr:ribonuclease Y [Friedmanniella luteola]SDS32152.1 ribonucrease Y [Friedmanniella luteola]